MIALLLLSAPAQAGDALLSGGLASMPTAASVVVPAWRLGYRGGRTTVWGTLTYASFRAEVAEEDEVSGFYLSPRLGLRLDLDDADAPVVPYLGASVTTRLMDATVNGDALSDERSFRPVPPLGGSASGGFDVRITDALSVSPEIGVEVQSISVVEDGQFFASPTTTYYYDAPEPQRTEFHTRITGWSLTGAVYINLWL